MTLERDIDGVLDRWLADGPRTASVHVIDAVTARIAGQPQSPAWRSALRRAGRGSVALPLVAAIAAILTAAVGMAVLGGPRPSPSPSPSASSAAPSPAPSRTLTGLRPGTWSTMVWKPAITYSVPAGWTVRRDDPIFFTLERGLEGETIDVVADALRPALDAQGCLSDTSQEQPVGPGPLLDYWTSHAGLEVSAREAVALGGLDGWAVDLSVRPTWTSTCEGMAPDSVITHLEGSASGLRLGSRLSAGPPRRYVVLEGLAGETILIRITARDAAAEADALAIVESFEFDVALGPGTYESRTFSPHVTYTVPEGWWREADDGTAFVLAKGRESPDNIELLIDLYPPEVDERGCQSRIDWHVPHGVDDLVSYWESSPALVVVAREAVSIGGLDGWSVDIAVRPSLGYSCGFGVGPSAPAFVVRWDDGVPLTHGIGVDPNKLVILAAPDGRTMVIVVRAGDPTIAAEAAAIVESFVFDVSP